jgi:hypoxanthine-DNA glycosylase
MTTSEDAATPRKSPSPATSTRSQCVCVATPSPTVQIATSRRTRHPRTLAATALTVAAISWSTAPRSGALAFAVTPDRERVSLASSLQPENDNNNNINHQPATVETKFNKKRRRTKHVVALDATLPPTPYAPPKTSRVTPNKHPSPETSNSRKRRLTGVAATGVPRTSSFPPLTADQFPHWQEEFSRKGRQPVLPHTLILGTHPSVTSLQQEQYYGHAVNAFWWIAGDCLGFRRASGVSPTSEQPYALAQHLRYDQSYILEYKSQLERFVSRGFALWDVIGSCQRKGSLDQDIQQEIPNDLQAFCAQYPSIRRIVLANGGTTATLFRRHFHSWLTSGQLQPLADHPPSQKAFPRVKQNNSEGTMTTPASDLPTITLIAAISVSPAAAKYSYIEKRDFWETHVYAPGLRDFETMRSSIEEVKQKEDS